MLIYGSEAWTIRDKDINRITASEMRFMRKTADLLAGIGSGHRLKFFS